MRRWSIGLLCALFILCLPLSAIALDIPPVSFTEAQLQQGEAVAKKALEATQKGDFVQAEAYWTQLIEDFPMNPAVWSNRGNARVSQHRLEEAISDYDKAIEIAPNATDPYLNRGAALEGQGHYTEAIQDYNRILELDPKDAMAYNNRGNAEAGLEEWNRALADYQKASSMVPDFAWANANVALTLYQIGQKEEALRQMRNLVRKHPMFPDMRAALTAILWERGLQGEAESNWVATVGMDHRYQDLDWVKTIRRWPPQMISALDKFLNLK